MDTVYKRKTKKYSDIEYLNKAKELFKKRIAWTGGNRPPKDLLDNKIFYYLYGLFLEEQINEWKNYWGDNPDVDTVKIFQNRALYDTWATIRDLDVKDIEIMKRNPIKKFGSRAKFKHKRLISPKKFAKKSLRTIKRGRKRIIVGCPKGKYDVRRKICRVGTRAQAVLTPKRNPIRHITKIKSERYAVYSPDIKGSEYPVKIFSDPNKAINYAIKRQRKTGFSSEVWFETPKGEHLSKRIYPEKYHKNPKETLYFIHGKSKKGNQSGLYNLDRNSLTTEFSEATHFHNKNNAEHLAKLLRKNFYNWNWSVKPTTFFEG